MKKLSLLLFTIVLALISARAAYVPVAVTGFNKDLIANGVGPSNVSSNANMDGVYALVASDFRSTATSSAPPYSIPASGLVNDINSPGLTFQMANFTGSNALYLAAQNETGVLTLNTPTAGGEVYLLVTSGNGGTTVEYTLTFTDNTTQVFSNVAIPDWFATTPIAVSGIGRVNLGTDAFDGSPAQTPTAPNLFEVKLAVNSTNVSKLIKSVTVKKTSAGSSAYPCTFAVTINTGTCFAPTALAVTSPGPNGATFAWTAPVQSTPGNYQYKIVAGTGLPTAAAVASGIVSTATATPTTLTPSQNYTVYVRSVCGVGDTSTWSSGANFYTTQIPATLPWNEGFENGGTDWSYGNGAQPNQWVTGTAIKNGGTKSLYITNDGGTSNAYTLTTASTVQVWRDVVIPTGFSTINLSFDWQSKGESGIDYFKVWAVPVTFIPTPGTQVGTGTGRTQIGGNFQLSNGFGSAAYTIPASFAGTTMRLIIEWRNDANNGAQPPAAIDNISMWASNCAAPTAVTTTNPTATGITLGWTAPASAPSNYQYKIVAGTGTYSAAAVATGIVSTNTATATTLTPSQSYTVYVRSICGVGDTSIWTAGTGFYTTQIPATLPWTDGFENGTDWNYGNGTQPNIWITGTAVKNGGTHSMYVTNDGASNTYTITAQSVVQAWRDVTIPTGFSVINLTFDWQVQGESGYDYFRIWAVPVSFAPTPGTQITSGSGRVQVGSNFQLGSGFTSAAYTIPASFAGTTMRLIFEWHNDGSGGVQPPAAIDNVSMWVGNCAAPTALTVTAPTATGVTLGWTAPASAPANYQYKIVAGAGSPTAAAVLSGVVSTTTITPTTLTPSQSYTTYVRSICSVGDTSAWTAGVNFYTTQIPATLPWNDGFESGGTDWSYGNGTQPNQWVTGSAVKNGGTKSLYITNDGGTSNAYTLTGTSIVQTWRDVTIPSGTGTINLAFDWQGQGESGQDYFKVWAVPVTFVPTPGTGIGTGTGRTQLGANFQLQNGFIRPQYTIPASFAGSTMRLIFEWRNNASSGVQPPAAIDNVSMWISSCVAPTAPTATNVTATGVTLGWTAPATAPGNYQYKIVASGAANTAPALSSGFTGNSNTTINVTGINPTTDYTAYIRSICGAGDTTVWSTAVNFSTPQIPVTIFPWNEGFETGGLDWGYVNGTQTNKWVVGTAVKSTGTKSVYVSQDNGVTNTYSISAGGVNQIYRDITFPVGSPTITLTFDWRNYSETLDYIKVWMVPTTYKPSPNTSTTAGAGFVALSGNLNLDSNFKTVQYVIPPSYAGTTARLLFEWYNSYGGGTNPPGAVDNVSITLSSCSIPDTLKATNITANSATATWHPLGTSLGWQIEYGPVGFTRGTGTKAYVTTPSYNITGLAANTNYSYYVRTACSSTDSSVWTAAFNFTTAKLPCNYTPSGAKLTSNVAQAICSGSTTTLVATDTSVFTNNFSGIIYRWQSAPSISGPWTYVTGGSGDSTLRYTTPGLVDTMYYRTEAYCIYNQKGTASIGDTIPVKVQTLPYYENFNAIANDGAPDCYVKNSANGAWSVRNDYHAADGTPLTAIRLDFPSAYIGTYASKNAFFTIPALKLIANNTYVIAYKFCHGRTNSTTNVGSAYTEKLKLFADTTAPGTVVANVLDGITLVDDSITTDYVHDTVVRFTPTKSGAYYFSWYSNTPSPGSYTTGGTIAIDSISVLLDCPSITFTTQPQVKTEVCSGDTVTLVAESVSTSSVTYQWQKDGVDIPGATNTTFIIDSTSLTDVGQYQVRVISGCREVISDSAEVLVNQSPVPGIRNTGATMIAGGGFTTYQWYLNDTLIPNATSYIYKALVTGKYTVVVTAANGCTGSSSMDITVDAGPGPGTGVAQINSGADIKIYPNPADKLLNLTFPASDNTVSIRIVDLEGRVMDQKNIEHGTKISFDVSRYASGVYMYQVVSGESVQSGKVVITH